MLDLTKMYFFRLFRAKSFYILLAITAVISFIAPFLFYVMLGMDAVMGAGPDVDVDVVSAAMENAVITLPDLFEFVLSFLMLLCGLGAAFIAHAEDKNGFIKNIAGQVCPRGIQAVSKLPVLLFEILVLCGMSILVFLGFVVFRENVIVGSVPELLKTVGTHLLLFLAFDAVIMLLTFLTKKSTLGIVLTVVAMTNILGLAYSLVDYCLNKYLHVPASFDIADFALDTYIRQITYESESALVIRGIIVGLVYLTACTAGSYMLIKKRDI